MRGAIFQKENWENFTVFKIQARQTTAPEYRGSRRWSSVLDSVVYNVPVSHGVTMEQASEPSYYTVQFASFRKWLRKIEP